LKSVLKNTWAVLDKKEKRQFALLGLLDIIISIVDILSLALLLWIIQFYIQSQRSADLSFLPGWLANKDSIVFIAVFFFLFSIKNLAAFLTARAQYKFIGGIAVKISKINLLNYQQSSFEEFINVDSSVHVRKISYQPFEFCQYILSGIQQIITQSFLITITIIAIILFNAKLFLLLLCILLPPVILVFYFIKKRLEVARSQIKINNERSFQYLFDALKGYVEGNIYNRNQFFLQRFINYRKKFSRYLFNSISIQNMPGRMIEIFAVLGLFILIAIAQWSGNNSEALITVGAFMAAAYKIIPGIVKVINVSGQIRTYKFSISELVQNAKEDAEETNTSPACIHSIGLKGVSFKYADLTVLSNFHLCINKGDFVGISGKSGRGKTTVFNLLLGFLSPAKGEIFINDCAVSKEEIKKFWHSISYVRQQSFFIHDTILRNITLEEEGYNKNNLDLALAISGLNELISTFSEGLQKVITENGKNISGGQQQRIALARAVYKNADLILLDEPFNELDEASEILMLEYFQQLAQQGKIVVIITHDKQSLSYCNKIISLDEQ
jgi:ABC-type bacteriocin/lantibiotic exporter with double-glycine peptidase domain